MRCTITAFVLILCFNSPALARGDEASWQADTYRPGGTYASYRGTTAQDCHAICKAEAQCAAWSLTPATFRAGPRCELKGTAGDTSLWPGAVSGWNPSRPSADTSPPQPRTDIQPPPRAESAEPLMEAGRDNVRSMAPAETLRGAPVEPAARSVPQPMTSTVYTPSPSVSPPAGPQDISPAERSLPIPAAASPVSVETTPLPELAQQEPAMSDSDLRPIPSLRPMTGPDSRKDLPPRRDDGVPTYSVQQLELLPGDYDDMPAE